MDPQWLKLIVDFSPALAAGVAATIFVVVVLMKVLGIALPGKSEPALAEGISEIKERLAAVENDITNRPTREEMHRLELSFTRLEGEVRSQGMTIQSTAAAIGRIEDYMYAAAASRRVQGPG